MFLYNGIKQISWDYCYNSLSVIQLQYGECGEKVRYLFFVYNTHTGLKKSRKIVRLIQK